MKGQQLKFDFFKVGSRKKNDKKKSDKKKRNNA